jgi:hypothetical protein
MPFADCRCARRSFCLGEDAHNGLGPGRANEHSTAVPRPERVDLGAELRRDLACADRHIPLHLRHGPQHRDRLFQRGTFECVAEEQRRDETVSGHVTIEPDDVPRLLAAEDAALAAKRLEHVAVADVGRHHADAVLGHQLVEGEVRHHRDGDEVDLAVEREHGEDRVAVDRAPARVDREHPIAVAVERDAEVGPDACHGSLQRSQVRRARCDVDVRPVRLVADCVHFRAELLERLRRELRVRAVRAVDNDLQP